MKKILSVILTLISIISLSACEKEPVIGYDPDIPQEWIDAAEEEKNRPDTEVVMTHVFDGIWENAATGKRYYVYSGHIFDGEAFDDVEKYNLWGTFVAVYTVEKERAEEFAGSERDVFVGGEELTQYISSSYISTYETITTMLSTDKTKTVADDNEFVFRYVEEVTDWPEGYEM